MFLHLFFSPCSFPSPLTDEPDVKSKVVSQIGLKTLVEHLTFPNAAVQKGAAVALGHYAGQEENQQVCSPFISLLSFALFLPLPLHPLPALRITILFPSFQVLYDMGIVEKLTKLFSSQDQSTVHAAAMAISNLSQNGITLLLFKNTHSLSSCALTLSLSFSSVSLLTKMQRNWESCCTMRE